MNSTNTIISVLRHRLRDAHRVAPAQPDEFVTDAVVSVISGSVVGEVDRVVFRDDQSGRIAQFFAARIEGIRRGNCGLADVETDATESLANLAAVAELLSDELSRLQEGPASDTSDGALYQTADGHGHRVLVGQVQDCDGIAITISTSRDPRDAMTAVLSRPMAVQLRSALEAV